MIILIAVVLFPVLGVVLYLEDRQAKLKLKQYAQAWQETFTQWDESLTK